MSDSVSPVPVSVPSAAPLTPKPADPTHLLELFRQLVPATALDGSCSANATLFTPWLVTWLMFVH